MQRLAVNQMSASLFIGLFIIVLSLLVMIGWHSHIPLLIQISPNLVPMQYNTALGFLLLGGALTSVHFQKHRLSFLLAALVCLLSAATLFQYATGQNLGIDELFMSHYITVHTPYPGRMSLHSATSFFLAGSALLVFFYALKRKTAYFLMSLLAGLVLAISLISLLGYATDHSRAYGISQFSQMAVHTSIGFLLIGTALLLLVQSPKKNIASLRYQAFTWIATIILSFFTFLSITIYSTQQNIYRTTLQADMETMSGELDLKFYQLTAIMRRMGERWAANKILAEKYQTRGSAEAYLQESWHFDALSYLEDENSLKAIKRVRVDKSIQWVEPAKSEVALRGVNLTDDPVLDAALARSRLDNKIIFCYSTFSNETRNVISILSPLFSGKDFEGWLLTTVSLQRLMKPFVAMAHHEDYTIELTQSDGTRVFLSRELKLPDEISSDGKETYSLIPGLIFKLHATKKFYEVNHLPLQRALVLMIFASLFVLAWLFKLYFRGQDQEQLVSLLYQRQSGALNTMLDGLLVISGKGEIQEVNRAALEMFGYDREELIGHNVNCLMPEPYSFGHDVSPQHSQAIGEKRVIGQKQVLEALRKDGSTFPTTLQVTEGKTGGEKFYTGVIQDLTEKRAVEEKIAEQDALLKLAQKDAWLKMALLDSSAGLVLQNEKGRLIEVNETLCQWLGYSNEELLDLRIEDILVTTISDGIDPTTTKMLSGEITTIHEEKQYRRKDGGLIWCMVSATVIKNEPEQDVEFIASHIINIEHEKRLSLQLKDAQHFQKMITDNNPDLIYVKDVDFKTVFANPAFLEQVSGSLQEELLNSEENLARIIEQNQKAFEEGHSEVIEKVIGSDGNMHIFLNSRTRFENALGEPFILGIARDVTEQETLIAKLEKSNEDLDQFAYIASHDLKSPLNAIQKIATWIEEDCVDILPKSSKDHLRLLQSRSRRMAQLLNDLLMYSRVGRYEYKDETVNLKQMAGDLFEIQDRSEGFTCSAPDVELAIPRIPFDIVLRNLISNSLKHHDKEEGSITIEYEARPYMHVIRVKDDGPGIPPELQKKAVEMFQTLRTRDEVEGSGMGLAMVKKIVEHYNGSLEFQSDGKRGLSMNIHWPRKVL